MRIKPHFQTKNHFSLSKLKLFVVGVLVVFLLGSFPIYGQDDFSLSFSHDKKKFESTLPKLTVTDSGESGVTVDYKFKGAVLSPMEVDGTRYFIPHIYGFSHMNEVGSPRLPAKNHHIAVPYGSQAEIKMVDAQFKEYPEQYMIHPALEPAPDCDGCPEPVFEINRGVYDTDADFPVNPVEIVGIETYMGVTVAIVQVRPLQFNPVTGVLKAYTKLAFKVTFRGRGRPGDRYATSHTDHTNRMVKNVVLNRSLIPDGIDRNNNYNFTETRSARKDYIMIVHADFLTAAEALASWKRQLGYSVEIVSQSSWTTTQVKTELQTRYDSWDPKPLYFLLFGDQEYVPAEYTGSRYTDLYYAEMEGSGYKPEMAYGRIFAASASEAQLIVDKIINYEKNPPAGSGFYGTAVGCAQYQDSNYDSYADRRFSHTSEDMRNYVMGQGYVVNRVYNTYASVTPQYYNNGYYSPAGMAIPSELLKPGFAWDGDAADILNEINAGRFMVWHRDHGSVTGWATPAFSTTNVDQLSNGNLLPVVLSINCLTGKFVGTTECFAERFLRKSGAGCVGIFAATEVSYSGPNDGFAPGLVDGIWPDPGIDPQYGSGGLGNPTPAHDPIYTMGDLLNFAKIAMESLWNTHQTTWELHHYFGDPAMQIWTSPPTTATASHPLSLSVGATSLAITGSNCPEGVATLVYEDTLVGKTTLAGDGTGTITFPALSGAESNAILTVSKHNFKPYIADIPVTSDYCDSSGLSQSLEWIAGVQVGDLHNTSGASPYTDYTSFVGHLTPGAAVNVTLTPGYSGSAWTESWKIWIDYNNDKDFDDPGEEVFSGVGNVPVTGSFTVIPTASGQTRMRVSMRWGGYPPTCGTFTYGEVEDYTVDFSPLTYCTSQGTSQSYEWIARVQVGDLDNSSGPSDYTNFTSLSANLTKGAAATVILTPGFASGSWTEYWKVWIDFNHDGYFDTGEEVFNAYGNTAVSGSFTVPTQTLLGPARMRVSMQYYSFPPACGIFYYGEVEDYTANIQ